MVRTVFALLMVVALAGCVQENPEPEASGQPAGPSGDDAVGQPVGGPQDLPEQSEPCPWESKPLGSDTGETGGEVIRSGHPLEGEMAPSYDPPSLCGDAPSLDELRGNVTLVFVWASWCGICSQDEPKLEEIYAEYYNRGFEMMAVSHENSRTDADAHLAKHEWSFPAYYDRGVNEHFGLRTYQPNYVLVDGDGVIQWVHQQGLRSGSGEATLRHNIDALL